MQRRDRPDCCRRVPCHAVALLPRFPSFRLHKAPPTDEDSRRSAMQSCAERECRASPAAAHSSVEFQRGALRRLDRKRQLSRTLSSQDPSVSRATVSHRSRAVLQPTPRNRSSTSPPPHPDNSWLPPESSSALLYRCFRSIPRGARRASRQFFQTHRGLRRLGLSSEFHESQSPSYVLVWSASQGSRQQCAGEWS